MSNLQEIQQWSQDLPGWQQDAIARLYTEPNLSVEDFDHLYALLKAENGLPHPEGLRRKFMTISKPLKVGGRLLKIGPRTPDDDLAKAADMKKHNEHTDGPSSP